VQLQRLVVDDRGTRLESQDVLFGRLSIHRDEEIDFFLPSDVPALARADGVPSGQPRDVRREHVLARNRDTPEEDRPQQDQIGGLAAGSVDGGDLNAEIVDDALLAACRRLFLNGYIARWHLKSLQRMGIEDL